MLLVIGQFNVVFYHHRVQCWKCNINDIAFWLASYNVDIFYPRDNMCCTCEGFCQVFQFISKKL